MCLSVIFLVSLFYVDPVYRLMCALARISAFQIEPICDWTRLYNANCLLENPYYIKQGLIEEDNDMVLRLVNFLHAVMTENYLYGD